MGGRALLGSLERHSQRKMLGRDLGAREDCRGHGSIPKAPRRDHEGKVGWGDSKCDSSLAGDGDQILDCARNETLGL